MDKERIIEDNNRKVDDMVRERERLLRCNNSLYTQLALEEVVEVAKKYEQGLLNKEEYIEHTIGVMTSLKKSIDWEAEADGEQLN